MQSTSETASLEETEKHLYLIQLHMSDDGVGG